MMRFKTEDDAAFDRELYIKNYPDIGRLGIDPWIHFKEHGWNEERRGVRFSWRAPRFDEYYYRVQNPDVEPLIEAGEYASGAEHWLLVGRDETKRGLRSVPAHFDEQAYLARRTDVAEGVTAGAFMSGYDHWLQWGRAEDGIMTAPSMQQHRSNLPDAVTSERARYWFEKGALILDGLISPERCDAVNARIDRLWIERGQNNPPISADIYLEEPTTKRVRFRDAPGDARLGPCKINDLVMHDEIVKSVALDQRLTDALRWVLNDDPVAIGSLNFERGSTQGFHTDTLFMPGRTHDGMTAAWIALEDVTPEAGPLLYYPGSHEVPAFRFSSGGRNLVSSEMEQYDDYMDRAVAARGLVPEAFLPKKGDVLIWHEQLYHGGAAIQDVAQTRKSLVVHYWRREDMTEEPLAQSHGAYYWDRPPL